MGSLANTQARIFHGDNLKNWPEAILMDMEMQAFEHIKKCRHQRCATVYTHGDGFESIILQLREVSYYD